MKNIYKYILYISISLGLSMFCFSSCNYEQTQNQEYKVYILQAKYTNVSSMTLYNGRASYNIDLASTYKAKDTVRVAMDILDSSYVAQYNKINHTNYHAVPSKDSRLSSYLLDINPNQAFSLPTILKVDKWDGFKSGIDYVIPVKMHVISLGGESDLIGSNILMVELRENVVSGAVETNTKSPTQAAFRLADGKNVLFGEKMVGKPYSKLTIEGKFKLDKRFTCATSPYDWRVDIFYGFGLQIITQGKDVGNMNVRLPDGSFVGAFGDLSLKKWYSFAITVDDGVISCYINGDLKLSTKYTKPLTVDGIAFGGASNGSGLCLDEFRIWNSVRTGRQIKKYSCIVNADDPNLMAYYKFNETSGKIAYDSTPHKHNLVSTTDLTWLSGISCP